MSRLDFKPSKPEPLPGPSAVRGEVLGFLSRFSAPDLERALCVVRLARARVAADPLLPLWRAIQTGDLDGHITRRVVDRYTFPANVVEWSENALRSHRDVLYLLDRIRTDLGDCHRGGWFISSRAESLRKASTSAAGGGLAVAGSPLNPSCAATRESHRARGEPPSGVRATGAAHPLGPSTIPGGGSHFSSRAPGPVHANPKRSARDGNPSRD